MISLAPIVRRPVLLFSGERAFPFDPPWREAIWWDAMVERVMSATRPDIVPWSL